MRAPETQSTRPSASGVDFQETSTGDQRFPAFPSHSLVTADHEERRRMIEQALFGGEADKVLFGRYHLLHRIGQGAMGVVDAAYDERLDRKIALKRIRTSWRGHADIRKRMLREARALARLAHPNVVYVFEVGEYDDQLFLAMEFLGGPTLRAWLDAQPHRPLDEVLAVFRQAGEGLAAAHAQGVVHRDFKPHNAMFGADGRVRVLDFGLARLAEANTGEMSAASWRVGADRPEVTMTGAVLGTPAYMAPEQFQQRPADARSDQFSFCVALFEALHGHRPFTGETFNSLARAVVVGRIRGTPLDDRVPPWVHAALSRGLATEPERRWPSMRALLDALERDPGVRRRRIVRGAALAAGLALVAGATEGHRRWDLRERITACEASGAAIDSVWGLSDHARLRAAFESTGADDGSATADRVAARLDARAAAWRSARTDACMNAEVRGRWDEALVDRALWCLDGHRLELAALVTELGRADRATVESAVTAAAGRADGDECIDEAWLLRQATPPVRGREALQEVRFELARADALARTGHPATALAAATGARMRALQTDAWPPLGAAARLLEADALARQRSRPEARAALREAYFAAAQAGAWDVAADAATRSIGQAEHHQRVAWERHAEVATAHVHDRGRSREAERLRQLAELRLAEGDHAQARSLYEQVVAIEEENLGGDHPTLATGPEGLARALRGLGAYAEAVTAMERALAIRERTLGDSHPEAARTRDDLADLKRRVEAK